MLSNYSRLLGGPFAGHDETHLREMSARMKDIPQNRRGRARLGDLAPSALVYLGQFLDHDLTRDETRLENASADPTKTPNLHAPRLNLESVYGGGPEKSPELYDLSDVGAEKFLVGRTKSVSRPNLPSTADDFFRCDGKPLLADGRNNQHLIIAQLHVVFLQFHNRIVDSLKRGQFAKQTFPNETIFETAQRLVTWHYQWIVRNEFLSYFVLSDVLRDIEQNGPRLFKSNGTPPMLPVEFTQAAFRFGHSVVQRQYEINQWIGLVRLRELIRKAHEDAELSANQVVDWDRFTKNWGGNANFAENIDTLISEDLFDLPAAAMPISWKTQPPPLAEMTLVRGSRVGLPSGQEACRSAGISCLRAEQVGFDDDDNDFLRGRGLNERTPLWYYLLREAELLGIRKFRGGECLGPLGSRIMAEVLIGVLNADPGYYRNVNPEWRPLSFALGRSVEPRQIDCLSRFIAFAKIDRAF